LAAKENVNQKVFWFYFWLNDGVDDVLFFWITAQRHIRAERILFMLVFVCLFVGLFVC
jgi:hypothetical protein